MKLIPYDKKIKSDNRELQCLMIELLEMKNAIDPDILHKMKNLF